jgi:hypothetical protein
MTKVMLSETELAALKRLGDILIPGARAMPVFSAVEGIDRLLQVAADATRTAPGRLSAALVGLPALNGLADAKAHAEAAPTDFALLSTVISGAYYMAREVLVALHYPLERRNPAGNSDFADEYMTGIVDPVIENNRGA